MRIDPLSLVPMCGEAKASATTTKEKENKNEKESAVAVKQQNHPDLVEGTKDANAGS